MSKICELIFTVIEFYSNLPYFFAPINLVNYLGIK